MENILDLDFEDIDGVLKSMDQPSYRGRQIMKWIWDRGVSDFELMTNVSKALRTRLAEKYSVFVPEVRQALQSIDGTRKFLLGLYDGKVIESVLIPSSGHYTQCVSTQAGCSLGCLFCSTGKMGFERNLASGEIAGQILAARRFLAENQDPMAVSNVVFMGMGEPLLNWGQVRKALGIIRDPDALNFSRRKVTLSTVGIRKNLEEFGRSATALLAVSLHAPDQELRKKIMPGASRYELDDLIADLESYPLAPRERITIEYVMLKGVNDSLAHAGKLVKKLSRVKCKINLLKYNPGNDPVFEPSDEETIHGFQDFLRSRGLTVMLRKSMGADILAACGQLKARDLDNKY
ncbi:MAG: 23S rRNA (adenine(2503)-C(2))-methyltransferase RlmN [Desulfonatronovibrio sp.]